MGNYAVLADSCQHLPWSGQWVTGKPCLLHAYLLLNTMQILQKQNHSKKSPWEPCREFLAAKTTFCCILHSSFDCLDSSNFVIVSSSECPSDPFWSHTGCSFIAKTDIMLVQSSSSAEPSPPKQPDLGHKNSPQKQQCQHKRKKEPKQKKKRCLRCHRD